MDDETKVALQETLERVIPATLDGIVRRNRDRFSVGLAAKADLDALSADVGPGIPKDVIDGWRFISFRVRAPGYAEDVSVHLLGWSRVQQVFWITSPVVALDHGRAHVQTRSGTRYGLGTPGSGEPDLELRLLVCRALRVWGLGAALGVVEVL